MKTKTRSLLEELDSMYVERDRRHIIENRATNVITSAVRLLEQVEELYGADAADMLGKKLFNAIKMRDTGKFTRAVRRLDENLRHSKQNTDTDQ